MKAISLHQPWASLLVTRQQCDNPAFVAMYSERTDIDRARAVARSQTPMTKRFETRSWPCPPALIGQPIAIHATKRPIDLDAIRVVRDALAAAHPGPKFMDYPDDWYERRTVLCSNGHVSTRVLKCEDRGDLCLACQSKVVWIPPEWDRGDLPLGAVVGSGRITACYPIVEVGSLSDEQRPFVLSHPSGHLTWHADPPLSEFAKDLSDQLPFGDFTPGRYAWLIEDAAPTTERCPWCWGKVYSDEDGEHGCRVLAGSHPISGGTWSAWVTCPVCDGAGRCDPIPARGAQRIWNWQP